MKNILIPQKNLDDYWNGTTGIKCTCGGTIEWAEASYVRGTRACRKCCSMFQVRGEGKDRRLVPQTLKENGVIEDALEDDDEIYLVPKNLIGKNYERYKYKAYR